MATPGALDTFDIDQALAEISSGVLMRQIAERWNCSKVAIYKRLSKHPEYPDAIKLQAESLVERAVHEVFTCDAATVNIARARSDTAFKYAAARDPARWGAKLQGMGQDGAITLEIVRYSAPVTIDQSYPQVDQAALPKKEAK